MTQKLTEKIKALAAFSSDLHWEWRNKWFDENSSDAPTRLECAYQENARLQPLITALTSAVSALEFYSNVETFPIPTISQGPGSYVRVKHADYFTKAREALAELEKAVGGLS